MSVEPEESMELARKVRGINFDVLAMQIFIPPSLYSRVRSPFFRHYASARIIMIPANLQ